MPAVRPPALAALALLLASAAAGSPASAEDPPFPAGTSSRTLEGLRCSVVIPEAFDAAKEHSLLVILHGAGGTETGMAGTMAGMAAEDFVVVAPKSTADTWDKKDLDAVRRITASLKKRLHVGQGRLHGVGFSNGGWNLAPLVFDEELGFATACWVASGYKGGSVPKGARKTMGVLALAGEQDGNRDAAAKTPDLLRDKVRSAECLLQPFLDHKWPEKLQPYLQWWLKVMEGRFTPGECGAFDWFDDRAKAEAVAREKKSGTFLYYWSAGSAGSPVAKAFQNETLRDPLVQRFGRQLAAVKQGAEEGASSLAERGIGELPAVVVLDSDAKPVKTLCGAKLTPPALAAALRSVAPDKTLPKR
jgi:predicted esterase